MRNGEVPIYEPHLDIIFERNIKAKRIQFTTNLEEAIDFAEIIFLALPTPLLPNLTLLLLPTDFAIIKTIQLF